MSVSGVECSSSHLETDARERERFQRKATEIKHRNTHEEAW